MKKLIFLIIVLATANVVFAMEQSYHKMTSLLDAFMYPERITRMDATYIGVRDYEKEDVEHLFSRKDAWKVIAAAYAKLDAIAQSSPEVVTRNMRKDPRRLTEKNKSTMQAAMLWDFLEGNDLKPEKMAHQLVGVARDRYANMWAKKRAPKLSDLTSMQLHPVDEPYVPFAQKIKIVIEEKNVRNKEAAPSH